MSRPLSPSPPLQCSATNWGLCYYTNSSCSEVWRSSHSGWWHKRGARAQQPDLHVTVVTAMVVMMTRMRVTVVVLLLTKMITSVVIICVPRYRRVLLGWHRLRLVPYTFFVPDWISIPPGLPVQACCASCTNEGGGSCSTGAPYYCNQFCNSSLSTAVASTRRGFTRAAPSTITFRGASAPRPSPTTALRSVPHALLTNPSPTRIGATDGCRYSGTLRETFFPRRNDGSQLCCGQSPTVAPTKAPSQAPSRAPMFFPTTVL
jgi:hypothetical protein